jgi:hypothetical protein
MSAYTIEITAGETVLTQIASSKRAAKREARRLLRTQFRGMLDVKGDVRKDGFGLVYQMETYRAEDGKVRIRDLEL